MFLQIQLSNVPMYVFRFIKTHSHVSVAEKTKVCYLLWHCKKSPNSAFHISKSTKLISTKFIYFLPYIYSYMHYILHISKLKEIALIFLEILYLFLKKLMPTFLHIFLHTKLQIYLSRIKITFPCSDFF